MPRRERKARRQIRYGREERRGEELMAYVALALLSVIPVKYKEITAFKWGFGGRRQGCV